MYKVQRKINNKYISANNLSNNIDEAKLFAENLDIGDKPEALRIIDDNGKVCAWVHRNGYLPSGLLAPEQKCIIGTVSLALVNVGSKSERTTHTIKTNNETYVLRLKNGNAMFDDKLNPLVGHSVKLIGILHNYTFIIDSFKIED